MLTPTHVDDKTLRRLETSGDVAEARLAAVGYVFHGMIPAEGEIVKRRTVRAGTNQLHFARCARIDRAGAAEARVWFKTIASAKIHLDEMVGPGQWSWCKTCQREITQRILDEE